MQIGLRVAASVMASCILIDAAAGQEALRVNSPAPNARVSDAPRQEPNVGFIAPEDDGAAQKIAWHYIWADQVTFRANGNRYRAVAISVPLDPIIPDSPNDSYVFGVVVNQLFQRPGTIVANIDRVTWENIDSPIF
jgi:hypothetical protein